jgi:hypothetical protein
MTTATAQVHEGFAALRSLTDPSRHRLLTDLEQVCVDTVQGYEIGPDLVEARPREHRRTIVERINRYGYHSAT